MILVTEKNAQTISQTKISEQIKKCSLQIADVLKLENALFLIDG